MPSCVICDDGTENVIYTKCCKQAAHKKCVIRWLMTHISKGRCMYCRMVLNPNFSRSLNYQDVWDNPDGRILIEDSSASPTCSIHCEPTDALQLQIKDVGDYVEEGKTTILTDMGHFLDIMNVPVGWLVRINGVDSHLQLSKSLRVSL